MPPWSSETSCSSCERLMACCRRRQCPLLPLGQALRTLRALRRTLTDLLRRHRGRRRRQQRRSPGGRRRRRVQRPPEAARARGHARDAALKGAKKTSPIPNGSRSWTTTRARRSKLLPAMSVGKRLGLGSTFGVVQVATGIYARAVPTSQRNARAAPTSQRRPKKNLNSFRRRRCPCLLSIFHQHCVSTSKRW